MPQYASPAYWNAHYTKQPLSKPYEWLQPWSTLSAIVRPLLAARGGAEATVLNVGCGNARLAEDMYDAGYPLVTSCDISPVVIDQMKRRMREEATAAAEKGKDGEDDRDAGGDPTAATAGIRKELKYVVADCTDMPEFEDKSFDVIIDKSTLDALLCDRERAPERVTRMLSEIHRVLKRGGTYVCVSFGAPKVRLPKLEEEGLTWQTAVERLAKPGMEWAESSNVSKFHYVYLCRKPEKGPGDSGDEQEDQDQEGRAEDEAVEAALRQEDLEEEKEHGLWGALHAEGEAAGAEAAQQEHEAIYGTEEDKAQAEGDAAQQEQEQQQGAYGEEWQEGQDAADEAAAAAAEAATSAAYEEGYDDGQEATPGAGGDYEYGQEGDGQGGGGSGSGGGGGGGAATGAAAGGDDEWGGWTEQQDDEGNTYYFHEGKAYFVTPMPHCSLLCCSAHN